MTHLRTCQLFPFISGEPAFFLFLVSPFLPLALIQVFSSFLHQASQLHIIPSP